MLRVMAGDTIEISAKAFYNIDNAMAKQGINVVPVIGAALAAMTNPVGTIAGESAQAASRMGTATTNSVGLATLPQSEQQPVKTVQPQSGLNFVLYNNVFEVVDENTGYLPVEDNINSIQILATDPIIMKEAGFIEIFANNNSNSSVYYDNMMVTHSSGTVDVLEVNAYYPFGMIMPGLSLLNINAPNYYKYSGKELQKELGLNWGDHGARMYDATVGRWWVQDPLAEKYYSHSSYHFAGNNPTG